MSDHPEICLGLRRCAEHIAAAFALVAALWLTACRAQPSEDSPETDAGPCGSGKARSCVCDDGQHGIAQCLVGGDWGECACTAPMGTSIDGGFVTTTDAARRSDGSSYDPFAMPQSSPECDQPFDVLAHAATGKSDPYLIPSKGSVGLGANVGQSICFYFKPTFPGEALAKAFITLPDAVGRANRWTLYGVDSTSHDDGELAPCDSTEPTAYVLAGFAPGTGDVRLPDDVAIALPSGPKAGLILEVHYDDPGQTELFDRTGVRICAVTAGTRAHTAAAHFAGSEAVCVPAGATDFQISGTCNPRTDMGEIHVLRIWPHMHQLGRRLQVALKHADGSSITLFDEDFDLYAQQPPAQDVVLQPGDALVTSCFYQNDGLFSVPYGVNATDEQCYAFITAWPAGALSTDPATLDPWRKLYLGPQAAERCLDPLGILGSCNGAADYP